METLYLEDNQIGDAGAKGLGEGLSNCTKLETLYLKGNQIGDAGAIGLGEVLSHCTNLKVLDLGHNQIGDAGAKGLGEGQLGNTGSSGQPDWRCRPKVSEKVSTTAPT